MESRSLYAPSAVEADHRLRRVTLAAAAAGSLLLAGCTTTGSSGTPPETAVSSHSRSPEGPLPTLSGESPSATSTPDQAEDCLTPRIPVFPGKRFKESNRADMQGQLDVLRLTRDEHATVTFRDVIRANAIVANSLVDPIYARAFNYANGRKDLKDITAAGLLAKNQKDDFFKKANIDCLSPAQVRDVDNLYKALVNGLAPKVNRQISAAARAAWQELKSTYRQFNSKYREQLESSAS